MRFSIYSEVQHHPGKDVRQLYDEVLEQIVHADRVGFDCYAIIEHFFFSRFSVSANPWAMFAAAGERTKHINFRTLGHPLPYYNPLVLASQIAQLDLMLGGRYEFGVVRGHGWLPEKAGLAMQDTIGLYEEGLDVLCRALTEERFSYDGDHYKITDTHITPRPDPDRRFRIFAGGTSDRTYELAGERGWSIAVPPLLPYEALAASLDLYRASCAKHGNEPDIVWIHACYVDDDGATARREAQPWIQGFLDGNASPLTEDGQPGTPEERTAARFEFYGSGILEGLATTPYDQLIDDDVVWVGTPDEVTARIEALQARCEGLTEVSITVNPGGADHWQAIKAQQLFAERVIPHFR